MIPPIRLEYRKTGKARNTITESKRSSNTGRKEQTLEKVFNKDASLAEKICTLFLEQGITIFSILTALSMTISTIVLAIVGFFGVFEAAGGQEVPHQMMKGF